MIKYLEPSFEVVKDDLFEQVVTMFRVPAYTFELKADLLETASTRHREVMEKAFEIMRQKLLNDIDDRMSRICFSGHLHPTFQGRIFCDCMMGYL